GAKVATRVGSGDASGRLAGFLTDTVGGASLYYGLLLGEQALGGVEALPEFDDYLVEQIVMLSGLHLGQKAGTRLESPGLNRALHRMNQKTEARLVEAKANMEPIQGSGGNPPGIWQP